MEMDTKEKEYKIWTLNVRDGEQKEENRTFRRRQMTLARAMSCMAQQSLARHILARIFNASSLTAHSRMYDRDADARQILTTVQRPQENAKKSSSRQPPQNG
jgi:hypothetical protein